MQTLEQRLNSMEFDQRAPQVITEVAKAQDACRQANGSSEACSGIATSTDAICQGCREKFRELHGREPMCVTIPPHMVERMLRQ